MDEPTRLSFEAFVAARSSALLQTAFALTGDRQRAEDLLQVALMKSYSRWSRIHEPEAYLREAMVRTYATWWRRRWRQELPTAELPSVTVPGDEAAEVDQRLSLIAALNGLPPRQRAVLALRYFDDLPDAQIAQLLGISPGTVRSQAARGLSKLRTRQPIAVSDSEEQ